MDERRSRNSRNTRPGRARKSGTGSRPNPNRGTTRARVHSGEHLRTSKIRDIRRAVARAIERGERDQQGESRQRGDGQGGKTPGQPATHTVTAHGIDSEHGGSFTLTFIAYALDVQILDNHTVVTNYSNGVILTQRMQP